VLTEENDLLPIVCCYADEIELIAAETSAENCHLLYSYLLQKDIKHDRAGESRTLSFFLPTYKAKFGEV
jgi:hypothetical protein